MRSFKQCFERTLVWIILATTLISACTSSSPTRPTLTPGSTITLDTPKPTSSHTISPTLTLTPFPTLTTMPTLTTTPDMWKIQKCRVAPSVIEEIEFEWIWEYIGEITGRGEVDMLLNFTKRNENSGILFRYRKDTRISSEWLSG